MSEIRTCVQVVYLRSDPRAQEQGHWKTSNRKWGEANLSCITEQITTMCHRDSTLLDVLWAAGSCPRGMLIPRYFQVCSQTSTGRLDPCRNSKKAHRPNSNLCVEDTMVCPGCHLCFWPTSYELEVLTTPSNPGCQAQAQVATCTADQLATNQRFPRLPHWVRLIC